MRSRDQTYTITLWRYSIALLFATCSLVDSDEGIASPRIKVELSFPPPNFVFEHPDDVQISFSILDESQLDDIPGGAVDIEIDWDRRIHIPLTSDLAPRIPGLDEGPHVLRASTVVDGLQEDIVEVNFFVRLNDKGESFGPEELQGERWRDWLKSLMSLLVQHPPPDFVFGRDMPKFVEVRVTDREMQLGLEEAVDLMYSRSTIFQRRPYSLLVRVDALTVGEYRRAKKIAIPSDVAEGKHSLQISLKDVQGNVLQTADQIFFVNRSFVPARAPAPIFRSESPAPVGCRQPSPSCLPGVDASDASCSGHGRCLDGFCECERDWFGEECYHNVLQETRFLPARDPSSYSCQASVFFSIGASELSQKIKQVQFPSECRDAFVLRVPLQGIGIMIQFLVSGITEALLSGRTLLLHEQDWPWMAHPDCGRASFHCYFLPLSNCSSFKGIEEVQAKHLTRGHIKRAGLSMEETGNVNTNIGILVPSNLLPPHHGSFWYRSHVLLYLLQLWPNREAQLRALKNRIGFGSKGRVIGVHIRRGDSCEASVGYRTPCQPVSSFVESIKEMIDRFGAAQVGGEVSASGGSDAEQVLVASDDEEAVRNVSSQLQVEVIHSEMDVSMLSSNWYVEDRIRNGLLDAGAAGETAILDLFMLSSCDYFVGTFSSHFGALAFELMAARKGFLPPYISLDLAWAARH